MWQARTVAQGLRRAWPGIAITLVPVISSGDRDQSTPLYGMGGVGVFCSEVQEAVLAGTADCGVHSLKDLPTTPAPGLQVTAHLPRADPRDALVGADSIAALPHNATVASSSLRRRAQLAALRADLQFIDIRGNVHTRLRKIAEGQASATLLAMAGLRRLGLVYSARAQPLCPQRACIPAPGQGIVAVECRSQDHRTRILTAALDHHSSRVAADIERGVLAGLRGGCSLPLGCHAWRQGARWQVRAFLQGEQSHRHAIYSGPAGLAVKHILGQLTR